MKRFLFICMIGIFLIVGCTVDNPLQNEVNQILIPESVKPGYLLPISENNDTVYTWEVEPSHLLGEDGGFLAFETDYPVALKLTATKGGKEVNKTFTTTLKAVDESIFIQAWDYFRPNINSTITRDISFLQTPYRGVEIRYESTNPDIITSDGKVTKRTYDQTVTINCYLIYRGLEKMYSKEVTVTRYSDSALVNLIKEWVPTQVEAFKNGEIASLPVTHPEFGGRIRWLSPNNDCLIVEGHVLKKAAPQNFYLVSDIFFGSDDFRMTFPMENFTGGSTDAEILDAWLPTLLPTKILGSKNHLQQEGEWLALKYQERTNVGGVFNRIDGQIPDIIESLIGTTDESYIGKVSSGVRNNVSQSFLDQEFYPGYQMPNNLNILWIVVHESGMPGEGQDAELLNQVMHQKMINNSANSSWHYSVDAYEIYHHIPNHLPAWHASDGSASGGGNRNGIGIEMCINQDGNYEGAMHNNAKLIAYLLHEYNMTIANVRRHYDFAPDKKQCPSYMIRTNRYNEFLDMINREYIAMELLKDASVEWTFDREDLFVFGGNDLLFNIAVNEPTPVTIKLRVTKGSYTFEKEQILILGGPISE
ncbi:MAG: N-acetylmuramoyl-L-alanine amidase [Bacilli bacterium]